MEFDSLADIVSWSVSGLIFMCLFICLRGVLGLWLYHFTFYGALRLARFNVVHSSGNFQGLPYRGLFLVSFVISGIALPHQQLR